MDPGKSEEFNIFLLNVYNGTLDSVPWSQGVVSVMLYLCSQLLNLSVAVLQKRATFVINLDDDDDQENGAVTFETEVPFTTTAAVISGKFKKEMESWIIREVARYTVPTVPFAVDLPDHSISITVDRWDEHKPGPRTAVVSFFKTESALQPSSMSEPSDNPTAGSSYDIGTGGTSGTKDTYGTDHDSVTNN
jgi:hypothetical protein